MELVGGSMFAQITSESGRVPVVNRHEGDSERATPVKFDGEASA